MTTTNAVYFLIVSRAIKHGTGATEKFAPRTTTSTRDYYSGPFSSRNRAERAMVLAFGTHTCVGARIVDVEGLRSELGTPWGPDPVQTGIIRKLLAQADAMISV